MAQLVAHIDPYPLGDSIEGKRVAAHRGSPAVDVNIRTCRATFLPRRRRRIICLHSSKWWEHGFEPKPGKRVPRLPAEQLTLRQVKNLRSVVGHHEIPTAEETLAECHRLGLIPIFEMKPSIWTATVLVNLQRYARRVGWVFAVMTVQAYGKSAPLRDRWEREAYARMRLAHGLQIVTVLIYRRKLDAAKWAQVLTGVKGRAGWTGVLGIQAIVDQLQKEARRA